MFWGLMAIVSYIWTLYWLKASFESYANDFIAQFDTGKELTIGEAFSPPYLIWVWLAWPIGLPFHAVLLCLMATFRGIFKPIKYLNDWAKTPDKIEPIRNYTKLLLATKNDSKIDSHQMVKLE